MILADTSVWIRHLARRDERFVSALDEGDVCMHPFVLGELACGNLRNRTELLTLFGHLPGIPVATDAEVLVFIERRVLMGRGIGFVDAHLLASIALSRDTRLWTLDKRLARVAEEIGLPVVEPS